MPAADDGLAYGARLARHYTASAALALLSDAELADRVASAEVVGAGIGGVTARLDVGGTTVFVKRIPLTDLERRPEHVRSTVNLHGLPPHCQYGIVSPGFGAWRELAANTLTTNWVLAGRHPGFPLMYHWRVLPGAPAVAAEHADIEASVAFMGGDPAVRDRLEALARASASLVLFLEHLPHRLGDWLAGPVAAGGGELVAACRMMEQGLVGGVDFLQAHELHHFDAHLGNLLTDGRHVYFVDFGLAVSPRFALSPQESAFLTRHATHDAGYVRMRLVNWLVQHVVGVPVPDDGGPVERNAYIRECASGRRPEGVEPDLADMIVRHAPVAALMNDFYWQLFDGAMQTPYPADEVARALPR
ncbi:serine/threonine protein phosphatase [Catellatospora sichuanensis]|uniref:serine/threonine protein phosphatase n=1 Tax=Catellatospora sichuanensis TaxID=1969805 RepID=UPI0011829940|nr:serine/threonine protein phosphatase [Catellatospora sichuanensis]